jgi:hypothetical protein
MVDVLGALAASWGVLMAIGFALWAAYGVSLENPAIILPNSVAFLVGVATMVVAWRYRAGTAREA